MSTVTPALRRGDLARDAKPVVEDEGGDHSQAEYRQRGAEQRSDGEPDKGVQEAPADAATPAESMVAVSSRRSRRTCHQMTLTKMARSSKAASNRTTAVRCPCPSRNVSARSESRRRGHEN
jgi:hypothetical protein